MEKLEKRVTAVEKDVKKILEIQLPKIDSKIAVLISQMVVVMAGMAYLILE